MALFDQSVNFKLNYRWKSSLTALYPGEIFELGSESKSAAESNVPQSEKFSGESEKVNSTQKDTIT